MKFETPVLDVLKFEVEDVITTSNDNAANAVSGETPED